MSTNVQTKTSQKKWCKSHEKKIPSGKESDIRLFRFSVIMRHFSCKFYHACGLLVGFHNSHVSEYSGTSFWF